MCVTGEGWGEQLPSPWRKVLNRNCQLLMNRGHCPTRCNTCSVLGKVAPFSVVCGKIRRLLEMLIASRLGPLVPCFPQIGICCISRGIFLAWLQCIYLKLTGMILSEIKFPLWHSLLIPRGRQQHAQVKNVQPRCYGSPPSAVIGFAFSQPLQGFGRSRGRGKSSDSPNWNPGLRTFPKIFEPWHRDL